MFNTVKHTPIFSGRIFKKKIEVTYIKFHPSGKKLPVVSLERNGRNTNWFLLYKVLILFLAQKTASYT